MADIIYACKKYNCKVLIDQKEVASWQLEKAWPTKYTASDFNATSNEVAIESLELACEGISRTKS